MSSTRSVTRVVCYVDRRVVYCNENASYACLIQLACLTTIYYNNILNGPVSRNMLNEAYSSRYPYASSPISTLF
jgi:hypothetical protein